MFGPDDLNKLVSQRLASNVNIPAGHKSAIFAFVDSNLNVSAGFAFKTENGWQVVSEVHEHPSSDGLGAGLNILKTF